LLALEQQVRDHNADPWRRPPGWSVEEARKGRLQWACAYCVEQGRALIARPWIQTFCDALPYFAYYDRTLTCTDCQTSFVFSAREQQYWYETLMFWVQSRPKQCPACRRKRRQDKQAQAELKTALDQLNADDADQLLHVADLYARLGRLAKARAFFGRARKRAGMDMRDLGGLRLGLATAQKDLNPVLNPWRICFARGGFHPDLVAEAAHADNRIVLVDPDRLYT